MGVLVTGSSGLVGANLCKGRDYIGIDSRPHLSTNFVGNIADKILVDSIFENHEINTVINCAAARFDFGIPASDYLVMNVSDHKRFLENLSLYPIQHFIHVSSVASFDGIEMDYSDELECDDAYRVTKYMQEQLVRDWCKKNDIKLTILYPSAIFQQKARSDTNIGKLQLITKYLPFIPNINVRKSLTFLPNFVEFISDCTDRSVKNGIYLTIDKPILSVTEILTLISGNPNKSIINIPYFKRILSIFASVLDFFSMSGRIDLGLTVSRVEKLYRDTSYENLIIDKLDRSFYANQTPFDYRKSLRPKHGNSS